MKYKEYIFDAIDSEEKAYWLGFIHADGYLNERSLEIELKESDIRHLEKFADFIMETKRPTIHTRCKKTPTCRICLGCKRLVTKLKEIEVKSANIFEKIPDELRLYFIRGLFDGDGSIGKDRIDIIGLTPLIESIKTYFECGRIEYECYKNISRIYIYGIKQGNARKILDKLYFNPVIYLDRKYSLFLSPNN